MTSKAKPINLTSAITWLLIMALSVFWLVGLIHIIF